MSNLTPTHVETEHKTIFMSSDPQGKHYTVIHLEENHVNVLFPFLVTKAKLLKQCSPRLEASFFMQPVPRVDHFTAGVYWSFNNDIHNAFLAHFASKISITDEELQNILRSSGFDVQIAITNVDISKSCEEEKFMVSCFDANWKYVGDKEVSAAQIGEEESSKGFSPSPSSIRGSHINHSVPTSLMRTSVPPTVSSSAATCNSPKQNPPQVRDEIVDEKVRLVMSKAECTREEATRYLIKADNDIRMAIAYCRSEKMNAADAAWEEQDLRLAVQLAEVTAKINKNKTPIEYIKYCTGCTEEEAITFLDQAKFEPDVAVAMYRSSPASPQMTETFSVGYNSSSLLQASPQASAVKPRGLSDAKTQQMDRVGSERSEHSPPR